MTVYRPPESLRASSSTPSLSHLHRKWDVINVSREILFERENSFVGMSTPPRRRSRRLAAGATAAPSPSTPPPTRLLDLPTDLLVRVVSRCDPVDIARAAAVSLLFLPRAH